MNSSRKWHQQMPVEAMLYQYCIVTAAEKTVTHLCLSHLASSCTSTCFYRHFAIIEVTCFLTVFINKNYFIWELNAQNLIMMMMIMKMINRSNLLWYIKGPRLRWMYFIPYQHVHLNYNKHHYLFGNSVVNGLTS